MNDVLKIRTTATTARKFRVLAAELGCTMGELLKAITYLVRVRELTHGQLAQAHVAAASIPESGWTGDDVEAHRRYLNRVAAMATPAPIAIQNGDPRCAAHFETKAAKVGEAHEINAEAVKEMIFQQDMERRAYGLDPVLDHSDDMTPATFETLEATLQTGVTPTTEG